MPKREVVFTLLLFAIQVGLAVIGIQNFWLGIAVWLGIAGLIAHLLWSVEKFSRPLRVIAIAAAILFVFSFVQSPLQREYRKEHTTELPPLKVSFFEAREVEVGKPAQILVHYQNVKDFAIIVHGSYAVIVREYISDEHWQKRVKIEDEVFNKATSFAEDISHHPNVIYSFQIPSGAAMHTIIQGKPITQSEFNALRKGTASIYFGGVFTYFVGKDQHYSEFCGYTDQVLTTIPACKTHNDRR